MVWSCLLERNQCLLGDPMCMCECVYIHIYIYVLSIYYVYIYIYRIQTRYMQLFKGCRKSAPWLRCKACQPHDPMQVLLAPDDFRLPNCTHEELRSSQIPYLKGAYAEGARLQKKKTCRLLGPTRAHCGLIGSPPALSLGSFRVYIRTEWKSQQQGYNPGPLTS